jgi:RNA polymerase sigma-70 factor (ECF subfamily)
VTAGRALQPRAATQHGTRGSLGRELDLLHGAQAAWRERDSEKTLLLLDQHARRYPKSELRDERGALRVLALCELGRGREARRLGQLLIRRAPSSPVRATIEESCAFQ